MRFSKYNNPSIRRKHSRKHSKAYVENKKNELAALLSKEPDMTKRNALIDAYHITLNP